MVSKVRLRKTFQIKNMGESHQALQSHFSHLVDFFIGYCQGKTQIVELKCWWISTQFYLRVIFNYFWILYNCIILLSFIDKKHIHNQTQKLKKCVNLELTKIFKWKNVQHFNNNLQFDNWVSRAWDAVLRFTKLCYHSWLF